MNEELKVHWSVMRKDKWVRLTEYAFLNNIMPNQQRGMGLRMPPFYFYLYFSYPFY